MAFSILFVELFHFHRFDEIGRFFYPQTRIFRVFITHLRVKKGICPQAYPHFIGQIYIFMNQYIEWIPGQQSSFATARPPSEKQPHRPSCDSPFPVPPALTLIFIHGILKTRTGVRHIFILH
jgi:hypothetical protein